MHGERVNHPIGFAVREVDKSERGGTPSRGNAAASLVATCSVSCGLDFTKYR